VGRSNRRLKKKLRNKDIHNIIRKIEGQSMRLVWHVACAEGSVYWVSLKERDHSENLGTTDGGIIEKWIFKDRMGRPWNGKF
jgi:hypothetical protein